MCHKRHHIPPFLRPFWISHGSRRPIQTTMRMLLTRELEDDPMDTRIRWMIRWRMVSAADWRGWRIWSPAKIRLKTGWPEGRKNGLDGLLQQGQEIWRCLRTLTATAKPMGPVGAQSSLHWYQVGKYAAHSSLPRIFQFYTYLYTLHQHSCTYTI